MTAADGPYVLRILGPATGVGRTPFDGQWVVDYDPTRAGRAPDGRPMRCHLTTTRDGSRARRFTTAAAADAYWRTPSGNPPPADRPLTAWTVLAHPLSDIEKPG